MDRRDVLLLSPLLVGASAGCLTFDGLTDIKVSNATERSIAVDLSVRDTIREQTVVEEQFDLPAPTPDRPYPKKIWKNPIRTDHPHNVSIETGTLDLEKKVGGEYGNGPFSKGAYMVRLVVYGDRIELHRAVS